jgi:hypothetical protein
MKNNISIIALIVANSLPLAGVIWLDWAVFDVLILYWAENVVIGIINVMRMNKCLSSSKLGYFIIPFFIVHYGMFCFGHYSAVVMMFDRGQWHAGLWVAIGAIALSHLISYAVNFVARGEYQRTNIIAVMMRPYGRIIVLHISIIAGGFLVMALGNPFWMLPVLVVVKTVIDLRMHIAERRVFGVPVRSE